jgi:hypothetical protein
LDVDPLVTARTRYAIQQVFQGNSLIFESIGRHVHSITESEMGNALFQIVHIDADIIFTFKYEVYVCVDRLDSSEFLLNLIDYASFWHLFIIFIHDLNGCY